MSVVGGEMPKAWPKAALKAQAVAARTYALKQKGKDNYFDVNRIVLEFEFDSTGISEEFFLLLEDGSFLIRN